VLGYGNNQIIFPPPISYYATRRTKANVLPKKVRNLYLLDTKAR